MDTILFYTVLDYGRGVDIYLKILRKFIVCSIVLLVIVGGCLFYAFKIEPYRLKVNEFSLQEKTANTLHIKIVQISDLHIKEDFTYRNLEEVVDKVNQQNPDILVFTGDLYDNYAKYNDDAQIILELQKMSAKYHKIAIWGNRDCGGGASRHYESIMESAGFTVLENESMEVTIENNKKILFTGIDDSLLGVPEMPDFNNEKEAAYKIFLTHEPDAIDAFDTSYYDITLSGHSHGGQINIPFLSFINEMAINSSSLSSKYSGGMYTFSEKSNQKLYVNTGIGTTHISARFGVVPEITVFHLYL